MDREAAGPPVALARLSIVAPNALNNAQVSAIRALLWSAFGDDPDEAMTEDDWQHAFDGTHFLLDHGGELVAYASVAERGLEVGGRPVQAGYVEAVATAVARQGLGLGSRLMTHVNAYIRERFELGALGTGRHHFYERLGWVTWQGPTLVRTPEGPLRTPDEDGYVLVRASMKGQPPDAVRDAALRAVGDGAFLFSLALGLNVEALEFARLEGLRATAAVFWMGSLLGGPRADDLAPDEAKAYVGELADAWALWRTVVDRLSFELHVENEARATLQRRFFGGHDVFFADAAQAWADHVDQVERLMNLANLLATAAGSKPRRRFNRTDLGGSLTEHVGERVTRFVDDARVRAYEIMGDRPRAVAIMERRLIGSLR